MLMRYLFYRYINVLLQFYIQIINKSLFPYFSESHFNRIHMHL